MPHSGGTKIQDMRPSCFKVSGKEHPHSVVQTETMAANPTWIMFTAFKKNINKHDLYGLMELIDWGVETMLSVGV